MINRIQSIYLLLCFLISIYLFILPLSKIDLKTPVYKLLSFLIVILSPFSIVLFNSISIQMIISILIIIFSSLLLAYLLILFFPTLKTNGRNINRSLLKPLAVCILLITFAFLAYKNIQNDVVLINSIERIQ
jgi:hypothetical protein